MVKPKGCCVSQSPNFIESGIIVPQNLIRHNLPPQARYQGL
jgi:hypothetical protein